MASNSKLDDGPRCDCPSSSRGGHSYGQNQQQSQYNCSKMCKGSLWQQDRSHPRPGWSLGSKEKSAMFRIQKSNACMIRPSLTECLSDGSTRFNIQSYSPEALSAMNNFRHDGHMCDITLEVQGEQIRAHKLVLAACSYYFRGMFTNGMIEADSKVVKILETNITAETMRALVDFAYTQVIHITPDNVQSLLQSSIFFEMSHVIEACSIFMEEHIDPGNCIGIAMYARQVGCLDLEQTAAKFIEEHFCDVITRDEILTLEENDFLELISKDQLNIRCESEVFKGVVRWVKHHPEKRKCFMEKLLKSVRLSSLAPGFLVDQLKQCSLIRELPHCEQMLIDSVSHLTTHRTCVDNPRKSCKSKVIYAVGGFCRKTMESMSCFECYNPRTKEWTRLPDLPIARSLPGVASLKGLIYVLGGRLRKCGQDFDSCSVNVYSPIENKWLTRCPLNVPRNRVGVGILDNLIYAVGGRSGGDLFKSAERYDPDEDVWTPISDMRSARMGTGIAVVNRLLYAVGGVGDKNQRLSSVECYHPERNEWQDVTPLKHPRSGAGVAVLNDYIYTVGGFDGQNQLQSVERFDVKKGVWEEVTPLPQARSGIQLVDAGGKLYTLGGFDGNEFLSSVQSYDPETDSWHSEAMMLCKRSGHGVAIAIAPEHL